ncbi:hypothetical protein DL95DRAFT_146154 [Leptodontidium sp. 2 PMI_412]|nr:hypothetical protein BKA61DRAFT_651543 [Leptodontidium sp. MPI-SDFR-AT-0119]KAH9222918.1 hypothetical protein DL95DRAFT_146154 [Leptodontidium sp. 2 PMI_412]
MSGIPVYTSSPIKASKPTGTTLQTAAPGFQSSPLAPNPTSATTTAPASSSYPPAQPGPAAFPAPTSAAQQRYAPLQPTPTTKTNSGPPTPQPRAVPTPLNKSAVPPPPKAGEAYHPQQTGAPTQQSTQPFPPQMSYPPPVTYGSQPPSSTTSTTNAASMLYPIAIPRAEGDLRRSLEHPPGYHQNVYASELTSDQRRAQETEQANNSSGLGLTTQDRGRAEGFDSQGVWGTAKKWAQTAGEKISVAEAEVWKKINKD